MTLTPPNPIPANPAQSLGQAAELLRAGRRDEAIRLLRALTVTSPTLAQAHRLLGVALFETADLPGAERAYRTALSLEPAMIAAVVGLSEVLREGDRTEEAVAVLRPAVREGTTDLNLLTALGLALQSTGAMDEAIKILTRATKAAAKSAVAEHNLAGALGDHGRFIDSEAAARRAFAKGLDAPETWLVLARSLNGQARLAEARVAYDEALKRRWGYPEVLGDLAQLTWAETGDAIAALAVFDGPGVSAAGPAVLLGKAKLLDSMGDRPLAYDALRDALAIVDDPMIHQFATQVAAPIDPDRALFHAERAYGLRPNNYGVIAALCQANLAVGRPEIASPLAAGLCARNPADQYAQALQATAWRLLGDPRYAGLYDYAGMVSRTVLDTPDGWSSLETYLADLVVALEGLHTQKAHPVGQSLRNGTQTQQDLGQSKDPVILAFFQAIDGPIRRHIAGIGTGEDPLRRRISAAYGFNGAWSVRLRSSGFHINHVHPKGWLSSACHIAIPSAVEHGQEGWLAFGAPGIPTAPKLEAEHFVKPAPGHLVLFPSYMWHGTLPFAGDEPRLTIAFDVIPA